MGIRGSIFARVAMVFSLVGGLLATVPAHAATVCPAVNGVVYDTCVTSVSLSRSTATVSGAATVPLTVEIGIHSGSGVQTGREPMPNATGEAHDLLPELFFAVRTSAQASNWDRVGLALSSGDVHDGVWQGTINISGLDAGTMTTYLVSFGELGQPPKSLSRIPVGLRRSVVVTARHIPKFASQRLFFEPGTVRFKAPFSVMGRVVDAQTGAGMPRITVHVQQPNSACDCYLADQTVTTDAVGNWILHVPELRNSDYRAAIIGPANSDGLRPTISESDGGPAVVGVIVRAVLSTGTAVRGQEVTISGAAGPLAGQQMVVEKWVSHTWQPLRTAPLRASGRFDIVFNAPTSGHWQLRVRDRLFNDLSPTLILDVR
jgi:hypothetical protein